jgi:hypothetical protein
MKVEEIPVKEEKMIFLLALSCMTGVAGCANNSITGESALAGSPVRCIHPDCSGLHS